MTKPLVSGLALFFPLVLSAQAGQIWVQGEGNYLKAASCDCIKPSIALGVNSGLWLNHRWGLEAEFFQTRLKSSLGDLESGERHVLGSVLVNLNPHESKWVPYLRAGLGFARIDSPFSLGPGASTRMTYHGGLGFQKFIGEHGLVSLEVRNVTIQTQGRRSESQGMLGVGFRWGSPRPVRSEAAQAPAEVTVPVPSLPLPVPVPPMEPPVAAPPPEPPVPVEPRPRAHALVSAREPEPDPIAPSPEAPNLVMEDDTPEREAVNARVKAAKLQETERLKAILELILLGSCALLLFSMGENHNGQ